MLPRQGHRQESKEAFAEEVTGKIKIYLNDIKLPPLSISVPERKKYIYMCVYTHTHTHTHTYAHKRHELGFVSPIHGVFSTVFLYLHEDVIYKMQLLISTFNNQCGPCKLTIITTTLPVKLMREA